MCENFESVFHCLPMFTQHNGYHNISYCRPRVHCACVHVKGSRCQAQCYRKNESRANSAYAFCMYDCR